MRLPQSTIRAMADQWAGRPCSLDGRPATVCGRLLPFARIRTDEGHDVEFAWPTVDRIMDRDGAFRS